MTGDIRKAGASARHKGSRRFSRGAATALALLVLAACTSGDVMELRPEIDVGTHTSAMSMPELEPVPATLVPLNQPILDLRAMKTPLNPASPHPRLRTSLPSKLMVDLLL